MREPDSERETSDSNFHTYRDRYLIAFLLSGITVPIAAPSISMLVQRKWVVTRLSARCCSCRLLYRTPTDAPCLTEVFYQDDYSQGYTTNCPSPKELQSLIVNAICRQRERLLEQNRRDSVIGREEGARILDYGFPGDMELGS